MSDKSVSAKKTSEPANTDGTALLDLLATIDRPVEFCVAGDREFVLPGLEVDGLGTIGLPLAESTAKELIKICRQAPYGKGTETVVDTKVRKVWELDPSSFKLTNPAWQKCVNAILEDSQLALGLEKEKLTPHLYKMLVYEKGSFFLPHRDGEKIDGMVATLVIVLPSKHSGGELVVSHDDKTRSIAFSDAATGHGLSYALFYADCKHEVRKLTSGIRFCLTYNVKLTKSKSKRKADSQGGNPQDKQSVLLAPSYAQTIGQVADFLTAKSRPNKPWKIAVTLDHAYTKDGLRIGLLKGTDRAKADVLFAAAELAGCVAHLAIVTHWQSGSAEGGDDYGSSRYRRSYDEYDAGVHVMGEVYDESLVVDDWSDRDGQPLLLGDMSLDKSEVVSTESIDDWEASREEFEGYTGNAGMTLERWYHRAAIVIWPSKQHFRTLCDAGTEASIAGLDAMIKKLKKSSKSEHDSSYQDCLAFANSIVDTWKPASSWSSSYEKIGALDRRVFANALAELDNVELIQRFFSQVLPKDHKAQWNEALVQRCGQHGWKAFRESLRNAVQDVSTGTLERNLTFIEQLCSGRSATAEQLAIGRELLDLFVESVIAFDLNSKPTKSYRGETLDQAKVLETLVDISLTIGNEKALKTFVDHALSTPTHYDLTETHLKAIFALEKRLLKKSEKKTSKALVGWLKACQVELESRTTVPPQPPEDYRRSATMGCSCADCVKIAAFLKDPNTEQLRFPAAKPRRQHMHGKIDSNKLDLTHVTDRRGSPQTLVLTKTNASFDASQNVHDLNLKNLAQLNKLLQKLEAV